MAVKKIVQNSIVETKLVKYELMVIIKPLLPEDIRTNIQKKINSIFTKTKGKITSTDAWGKRHLAYKIEGHNEGYYIVYKCEMPQGQAAKFDESMRLNTDILRYLLTKVD